MKIAKKVTYGYRRWHQTRLMLSAVLLGGLMYYLFHPVASRQQASEHNSHHRHRSFCGSAFPLCRYVLYRFACKDPLG